MAQPGREGFEDVLREAEALADDIVEARKAVQAVETEAKRTGGKLVLPQPGVPRLEPKRAIPQEVTQYENLTRAVEANERALRRLNQARAIARPLQQRNVSDLSLEERALLKRSESEVRRAQNAQRAAREQVNLQRTLASQQVGGTEEFNEAETKRVYDTIRGFVKQSIALEVEAVREGEREKAKARQEGADEQQRIAQRLSVQAVGAGERPFALLTEGGEQVGGFFKSQESAQARLNKLVRDGVAEDVAAVTRGEEAKTAVVEEEARKREALTESQRRMLQRAVSEGHVAFDPGFNRRQMEDALALAERGLLQETSRTGSTTKRNARISFGATEAGLRESGDLDALRARAEVAERELDDTRARLRRARNPQRRADLERLIDVYERDLRVFADVEKAKTNVAVEEGRKREEEAAAAARQEAEARRQNLTRLAQVLVQRREQIQPPPVEQAPPRIAPVATGTARALEEAREAAELLDREYREAVESQKRLSTAQRGLLRDIAENQGLQEATVTTRGFDVGPQQRRTAEALQRRGLIEMEGHLATATSAGLGAHDPALVQGDIANHQKYIATLEDQVEAERQAAVAAEARRASYEGFGRVLLGLRQEFVDLGRASEVAERQVRQITLPGDAAARTRQLKAELRDIGKFTVRSEGGGLFAPSTSIFGRDAALLEQAARRLEQAGLFVSRSLEHGFLTVTQTREAFFAQPGDEPGRRIVSTAEQFPGGVLQPDKGRFLRERRDILTEATLAAREEQAARLRELNKAEGQMKAAYTRLRNARGDAFGPIRPFGEAEGRFEASIERAEEKARLAKQAYDEARVAANQAAEAEKQLRDRIRDSRREIEEAPPPREPPKPPPTAPPPEPEPERRISATQRAIEASRERQAELRERRAQAAIDEQARQAGRIPAGPDLRQALTLQTALESTFESIRRSVQAPQALARAMEAFRERRVEAQRIPTEDLRLRQTGFERLAQALTQVQQRRAIPTEDLRAVNEAERALQGLTTATELQAREAARLAEAQRRIPVEDLRARTTALREAQAARIPARDLRGAAIPERDFREEVGRVRRRGFPLGAGGIPTIDLRAVNEYERALSGLTTATDIQTRESLRLAEDMRRIPMEDLRLAAGGGGRRPPPTPPPTAPPPGAPPPGATPPPPGPGDPRFIAGQMFLSEENVRRAYQTAQAAQLVAAGFENASQGVEAYESAFARASDIAETQNQRLRQNRLEVARSMSEYGAFSNEMRKHGAATTEFLTALAQGRTTIGEVGFQAAATAGKFAAWTVASVGVYGALTTLSAVGRGAIDSLSGINELERFINDLDVSGAQEQFRALSREFNLPIAEVTQAFAAMGKTFHDQNDAFEATRQVLLAMRVGELEVADATRFLSAIVQGFRLQASDLPTVIDQINQAQNQFNFSIRDGVAGIARAAGTWKAAAGDGEAATDTFSTLLAVMTTAQRSTGATGEVVGTALRRSAEFIGREANRIQLRGFGIDPDQGITAIFRQAFAKVQTGQVAGQDITRLATALSSPQLAAVIGPTLQNFQLFNQALAQTNAEASKGSARRELAIQLGAIREQASRVVRSLEQLGSALGQAGAFDSLGALLKLLSLALETTTDLVSTFTKLPDGIQKGIIYLAQLYGVARLLRRLNVGESLQAAAGASTIQRSVRRPFGTFTQRAEILGEALSNPAERQRLKELLGEQAASLRILKAERELLARETASLARQTARATERVGEFQRAGGPSQGNVAAFGMAEAQRRFDLEAGKAADVEAELLDLRERSTREVRRINDEITHMEQRLTRVAQVSRRRPGRALEIFENDPLFPVQRTVQSFERPSRGELAQPIRGIAGGATPEVVLGPEVRETAERQAQEIVEQAGEATARDAAAGAAAGTAVAARQVEEKAGRARGAVRAAGGALRTASLAIRGFGSALLGFLGPIELAFIGLMFLPDIFAGFQRRAEESRQAAERLETPAQDPDFFRRQVEEANKRLESFDRRQAEIDRVNEANRKAAEAAARGDFSLPVFPTPGRIIPTRQERAALAIRRQAQERAAAQAIAQQRGQAEPGLFLEDIQLNIERDIAALKRGDKGARSALEIYAKGSQEIADSQEAGIGTQAKLDAANERLAQAKYEGDPEKIEKAQKNYDEIARAHAEVARAFSALDVSVGNVATATESVRIFQSQRLAELATTLQQQAIGV